MENRAKANSKRKRVVLTITQKLDIIRRLEKGQNKQELMRMFNIGSSTLYDIKSQKEKLMAFASSAETSKASDDRKTLQQPKHEKLDKTLYQWFLLKREEGVPISGPLLIEKARDFSQKLNIATECKFSDGWLSCFKKRHGIRKLDISGEKKSADNESADEYSAYFENFIKENEISLEHIYNADETGIYFRCLPTSTLAGPNETSPDGFKKNKERITALICANATGSHKIKLLIIGKSKNPRKLAGITHLPVAYKDQKNAWMDQDIFMYWFKTVFVPSVMNELEAKGAKEPRKEKVILLIDNCRAHPTEIQYGNITVMFLPPNVTSLIQPMDQGIIQNLKMNYRKIFMRKLINEETTPTQFQKNYSLKDAIYDLASAWNKVKAETLRKGWRKLLFTVTFLSDSSDNEEFEGFKSPPNREINEIMQALKNPNTNSSLSRLEKPDIENWMNTDKNIPITEILTEEQLIYKLTAPEKITEEKVEESTESEDETIPEEKITWSEAHKSLTTFLNFCERNSHYSSQEILELHLIKERFMKKRELSFKQTDIRHAFPSTSKETHSRSDNDC